MLKNNNISWIWWLSIFGCSLKLIITWYVFHCSKEVIRKKKYFITYDAFKASPNEFIKLCEISPSFIDGFSQWVLPLLTSFLLASLASCYSLRSLLILMHFPRHCSLMLIGVWCFNDIVDDKGREAEELEWWEEGKGNYIGRRWGRMSKVDDVKDKDIAHWMVTFRDLMGGVIFINFFIILGVLYVSNKLRMWYI